MSDLERSIHEVLEGHGELLSSAEIAERLGVDEDLVHQALWAAPETFAWQPGHVWSVVEPWGIEAPSHPADTDSRDLVENVRPGAVPVLHATTLASGLQLVVRQRAMDSEALLTVRSQGNQIELIINADHQAFSKFPLPFTDYDPESPQVLELLLEAWAIYEEGLHTEADRRAAEAARLGWGRKLAELVGKE